jgi:Spy/CpxP family protein refolding chaperone
MTRRTLAILLVISVGINVGIIGTLAYNYFKFKKGVGRGPEGLSRWFEERFDLSPEQAKEVDDIISSDREEMDDLRSKIDAKMEELAALLDEDDPDRQAIEDVISDLSSLRYEIEKSVVENMLEIRGVLTPEQVEEFNEDMGRHLCPPRGMGGRKGWGRGGRMGGGPID